MSPSTANLIEMSFIRTFTPIREGRFSNSLKKLLRLVEPRSGILGGFCDVHDQPHSQSERGGTRPAHRWKTGAGDPHGGANPGEEEAAIEDYQAYDLFEVRELGAREVAASLGISPVTVRVRTFRVRRVVEREVRRILKVLEQPNRFG